MDLPVKAHIERIHREIEALTVKQMSTSDRAVANEAEALIRSLKLALTHYELALKIENEVLQVKRANTGQTNAAD